MKTLIVLLTAIVTTLACNSTHKDSTPLNSEQSITVQSSAKVFSAEATAVLAKALAAHGGDHYEQAHYQFVLREKTYAFINDGSSFRYQVSSMKGDNFMNRSDEQQ